MTNAVLRGKPNAGKPYTMRRALDKRLLWAASIALVALSSLADAITVAQGETRNVTASATITAMEVHGTLRLRGNSDADGAVLTFSPTNTAAYLGTAAGDNAVIDIGDYGRIKGGQFTIGGSGGVGGFVVGGQSIGAPKWNGDDAHLAMGQLTVAHDATSASGTIDILTLNEGASAGFIDKTGLQGIINRSTSADARILFNGGTFYLFNSFGNFPFVSKYDSRYPNYIPEGQGGKAIVLESVNGNPINLRFFYGTTVWAQIGDLFFRGAGDVILHSEYRNYPYGWNWAGTQVWQQEGDLKLTGCFRMVCAMANVLPCSAANGIVQLLGNDMCFLNLNGLNQKVNGLIVSGNSMLSNNTTAATLTFGTGKLDGVMSVKKVGYGAGGVITAVKQGTGTLTVTNTPFFPAMLIEQGTVHFKDDDCTLDVLTAYAGTTVIVDGCTVTLNALADEGAAVSCVNGGKLLMAVGSASDEKLMLRDSSAIESAAGITKVGAGTTTICQTNVLAADVHVAEGTLALARPGTTNHWLRFSFTAMKDNSSFQLSEMVLMNAAGNRVDGGGSAVESYYSAVADADFECEPKDMLPKSVWASDQAWLYATTGYFDLSPSALFNGLAYTRVRYSSKATPENPKVFIVRMPAETTETYQYNFRNGYSGTIHPTAWSVETSPDGITWDPAGAYAHVAPPSAYPAYYNNGIHYPILGGCEGAAGFSGSANVQVDRGATLDCSRVTGGQVLSSLTVDCSAGEGVGTLVNVAFAAAGTINLENLPAGTSLIDYELPLAITDASATANLRGWTVCVNGVPIGKELGYRNGRMVLVSSGMMIFVR